MTYILSTLMRDKFLSIPTIIHLSTEEDNKEKPKIHIKISSLSLRYLFALRSFRFILTKNNNNEIIYFIEISDDPEDPFYCWSIIENQNQLKSLKLLLKKEKFDVHVYNELALNILTNYPDAVHRGVDVSY